MMDNNFIFQMDADNKSARNVADAFAHGYWDYRREVAAIKDAEDHTLFCVTNGTRTYEIVYVPYKVGVNAAMFRVYVYAENTDLFPEAA